MKNSMFIFALLFIVQLNAQQPISFHQPSGLKVVLDTSKYLRVMKDTIDITRNSHYIPAEKVMLTSKTVSVLILELSNKDKQVFLEDYGYYFMKVNTSGAQEIHWTGLVGTQVILNENIALRTREGDIYRCREQPNGEKCCEIWRDGKGSDCY